MGPVINLNYLKNQKVEVQIAILKSILKYSFRSLVLVFCIGCPNHKKSSQSKANWGACLKQRTTTIDTPATSTKPGSNANPTNSNNSDENKAEIENKEKINSHIDSDGQSNAVSTETLDQTNKKENRAQEIANNTDLIKTLSDIITNIKNKIHWLEQVEEFCNKHWKALAPWRLIRRGEAKVMLQKAGYIDEEIDGITSKQQIVNMLNETQGELKAYKKILKEYNESSQTATNKKPESYAQAG